MIAAEVENLGPPVAVLRSPYVPGFRFECRPISKVPSDRTIAFLYRREGDGYMKAHVGIVRDGAWVTNKGKPIEGDYLWAAMVDG